MARTTPCQVINLGTVDYLEAWRLQKHLVQQVHDSHQPNTLLILEHPPTYTMGRLGSKDQILLDDRHFAELGAPLHEVDRGGQLTFHGPGQLVMYPILNLRDWGGPLKYVRTLEQIMILSLSDFGISATAGEGATGVWVGDEKIGAIGVKISRGISYHGCALNVNTELSWYDHIVPCGITDRRMTSMARVLGDPVDQEMVAYSVVYHFGEQMDFRMREARGSAESLMPADQDLQPSTLA